MLKQMLVRDWDAHNVANVAKEEKNWLKRGSTGFIQSLFGPVSILFWMKGHFSLLGGTSSILRTFLGETSEKTPSSSHNSQRGIHSTPFHPSPHILLRRALTHSYSAVLPPSLIVFLDFQAKVG